MRQPCRDDRARSNGGYGMDQVRRGLDFVAETMATLEATAEAASPATLKVTRLLGELETYVCGQSDIIIDYATARRRDESISTAITESMMQWLVHRPMTAQQYMRWTPRGAHLMLKVRCAVTNGSLQHYHAVAEGRARRRFQSRGIIPRPETVSCVRGSTFVQFWPSRPCAPA